MTNNKPEVKRYHMQAIGGLINPIQGGTGAWVAASDYETLQALRDKLKLEAQCHAQEACTANATIAEIYQAASGGTGEPGNWNGAEPVRRKLEELQAECEQLRSLLSQSAPIVHAHAGASHMLDGFSPKRNKWDILSTAIDAAMQAKP